MKKTLKFLILLIFVLILAACGNQNNDGSGYSEFLPFRENLVLVYEVEVAGQGAGFTYTTFNSFIRNNRMQRLLMVDDGTILIEIMEMVEGKLVGILSADNAGGRLSPHLDMTDQTGNMFNVVLPENTELGTRWSSNPNNPDAMIREITSVGVSVSTPAGTFETIEVTTWLAAGIPSVRSYFAQGIGVVKEINYNTVGGVEANNTTRLLEIIEDGLLGNMPIAFPDADGNLPLALVQFTTNNDLLDIFNDLLVQATQLVFGRQLPQDALISHIFINQSTHNLHLDFYSGFLHVMQDVSDFETEEAILIAIVDTLGSLVNAAGVTITVEGAPYQGPFISFASMEFWQVGITGSRAADALTAQLFNIAEALHQPYVATMALVYDNWRGGANAETLRPTLETVFTDFFADEFLQALFDPHYPKELTRSHFQWHPSAFEAITPISNDVFQLMASPYFLQFVETEDGWRIDHIGQQ
ncbi:MAG: GerMN domain-containing protein [Defluviitaleaceae bacterium]|nr:GerMN domain-containing protein [Defluviitaleaceae bacterium]